MSDRIGLLALQEDAVNGIAQDVSLGDGTDRGQKRRRHGQIEQTARRADRSGADALCAEGGRVALVLLSVQIGYSFRSGSAYHD